MLRYVRNNKNLKKGKKCERIRYTQAECFLPMRLSAELESENFYSYIIRARYVNLIRNGIGRENTYTKCY